MSRTGLEGRGRGRPMSELTDRSQGRGTCILLQHGKGLAGRRGAWGAMLLGIMGACMLVVCAPSHQGGPQTMPRGWRADGKHRPKVASMSTQELLVRMESIGGHLRGGGEGETGGTNPQVNLFLAVPKFVTARALSLWFVHTCTVTMTSLHREREMVMMVMMMVMMVMMVLARCFSFSAC